jgi:hypothetical protein
MSEVEQTPASAPNDVLSSEPVEQPTEQVAADTTEPAVESDEQKNARELDERQKRSERASRGIQRRFDELTADKHAERQRADQLARTVEQLISMQQQGRGQPQPSDNAPRREQFADYESFLDARAEFKAEQRANAALSNWQQQQATQAQQALAQYQEQQRLAEVQTHIEQFGKKAGAEWEQYVASADDVQLPDQFQRTVLAPLGADAGALLLAIGKNPALAQQFWNRSPQQQLVMAAKIVAAAPRLRKCPKRRPLGNQSDLSPVRPQSRRRIPRPTWLGLQNT